MSFEMSLYSFHYSTGKVSKLIFENNIFFHRAHYKKIFQVKNFYLLDRRWNIAYYVIKGTVAFRKPCFISFDNNM